jgi:hypothetical protein
MVLLLCACLGCGGSAPQWNEYRNEAWGFQVQLPGKVREENVPPSRTPAGYAEMLIVSGQTGTAIYQVNTYRRAQASDKAEEMRLQEMARADELKGIKFDVKTPGQSPAGKFLETRRNTSTQSFAFIRTRYYSTPLRDYIVAFSGNEGDLSSPDTEKFFESLRITDKK